MWVVRVVLKCLDFVFAGVALYVFNLVFWLDALIVHITIC